MSITQVTSVLSAKETALVGVALSVASGCRPCTERYVRAAEEAGACKRGIRLAIVTALAARQSATTEIAAWAESLQGETPTLDEAFLAPRAMWQAIYSTGAAFAQRDTKGILDGKARATASGATAAQLAAVLAQARAILDTSRGHAETCVAEPEVERKAASPCGCSSC